MRHLLQALQVPASMTRPAGGRPGRPPQKHPRGAPGEDPVTARSSSPPAGWRPPVARELREIQPMPARYWAGTAPPPLHLPSGVPTPPPSLDRVKVGPFSHLSTRQLPCPTPLEKLLFPSRKRLPVCAFAGPSRPVRGRLLRSRLLILENLCSNHLMLYGHFRGD